MNQVANDFRYKWWALIGLSLLAFTAFLDLTIVFTAVPFIQKAFNASVIQLQWVTNIFAMLVSMLMIVSGRFGDLFGRRKVFYFGFVLFAIAAIGAGASQSIDSVIFFRGVQGFAAAIIFTLGVALLPQAFPEAEQTRAIGIYSAITGAGLALGPFIGGILIGTLSWRWVFWINIPIIIIGFLCCSFSLKESPKPDHEIKIDWIGLFLLVIGIGCLIFGVIHGEQYAWDLPATWINLIIGILALLLLLLIEPKIEQPLLDLSLFKNKGATLAALVCVVAGLVSFVQLFFDPLYLKNVRDLGAFTIGLLLFSVPLVQVAISLLLNKLVKRWGAVNLLVLAIMTALISEVIRIFIGADTSLIIFLVALVLMGYTWGIGNAGSISAICQSVKPERIGSSIGTVFTFWNVAGSIFLAVGTVLFHRHHDLKTTAGMGMHQAGFMSGYHSVAWLLAITMAVALVLGWILRK